MKSQRKFPIVCSPELGLSPDSNMGGEVHDREMIKALDDLGVVTLIILPLGKKYPQLKHAKVFFLPTPFVYPPWLFNFLILPYLFFLHRKYQFEILRVHSPNFVGLGALIFKFFVPSVKLVATYHHVEERLNFLDKFLLNNFETVTVVSEMTREDLGKGTVIPNGVDPKYKPGTKNEKILQKYNLKNRKVLLYLGQLIERKNIPFLFKVIEKLPKNYVLMICGDGPLYGELKNAAPRRVILTGKIKEEEKVDYYNIADVFVYSSLKEGYGLSVAEAIACGKPVVSSNIPTMNNIPLDVDLWVKRILHPSKVKMEIPRWNTSAKLWLQAIK